MVDPLSPAAGTQPVDPDHLLALLQVFGVSPRATVEEARRVRLLMIADADPLQAQFAAGAYRALRGRIRTIYTEAGLAGDPSGDVVPLVERMAALAKSSRVAFEILTSGLDPYREFKRVPSEADANVHREAAERYEAQGLHLLAEAERAVAEGIRLRLAIAEGEELNSAVVKDLYELIGQHQDAGRELAHLVNAAHTALDSLGVPRLPEPYAKSIQMRIRVLCSMRQRAAGTPTREAH